MRLRPEPRRTGSTQHLTVAEEVVDGSNTNEFGFLGALNRRCSRRWASATTYARSYTSWWLVTAAQRFLDFRKSSYIFANRARSTMSEMAIGKTLLPLLSAVLLWYLLSLEHEVKHTPPSAVCQVSNSRAPRRFAYPLRSDINHPGLRIRLSGCGAGLWTSVASSGADTRASEPQFTQVDFPDRTRWKMEMGCGRRT